MTQVRVALPAHLRSLARVQGEVTVAIPGSPTIAGLLDALEEAYPALKGTIRDPGRGPRRAFMRFFACGLDLSHEPMETALPATVVSGDEVFTVIGAIAGG